MEKNLESETKGEYKCKCTTKTTSGSGFYDSQIG